MHKILCWSFLVPVALAAVPPWPRAVSSSGFVSESVVSLAHPSRIAESEPVMRLLSPDPQYPVDPRASPFCTWWFNYEGNSWDPTCEEMPSAASISLAEWHRWNPIIAESCDNYRPGNSYCIEAFQHPVPTTEQPPVTTQPPTTTTQPPTTTQQPPITTTTTGNGIATPTPNQPDMATNCNKFHLVRTTTTCQGILDYNNIGWGDFLRWNPGVGSGCENLWLGYYACVGVIGGSSPPTTTTTAGNGISTPTPNQPGMATNCNKFHFIRDTTTCAGILNYNNINWNDFLRWNPAVGTNCESLWLGTYACVGEIPGSAPTTTAGNGVSTPTPNQPGMATNCNKFHLIRDTTTCQGIVDYNSISMANFHLWNPNVGVTCQNLHLGTYACVGIIGGAPTPTTTGNGVATPTPNLPGMATNCNKFHLIRDTTTCQGIVDYNSITLANFLRWNPNVGANCQNLQLGTYACVGVIGGAPTPTTTGNGVATPTPNQPGIVTNCNKFHLIRDTTTCQGIVDYNSITMANFLRWNTGVSASCNNLWLGTYACVGVIGGGGTPTTTTPPGIATPTPTQAGMVSGCTKFHHIRPTTICANVLTYNSITLAQFVRWNPAVGSNCQNLWANTYACVAGP